MQRLGIKPETRLTVGLQSETEETNQVKIEISGTSVFLKDAVNPLIGAVAAFGNVTNATEVINELVDASHAIARDYDYDGVVVHVERRDTDLKSEAECLRSHIETLSAADTEAITEMAEHFRRQVEVAGKRVGMLALKLAAAVIEEQGKEDR